MAGGESGRNRPRRSEPPARSEGASVAGSGRTHGAGSLTSRHGRGERNLETMKKILAVLALSALAFGALSATAAMADPPAPQSPIVWSGNGTNGGFCADVSTDAGLPA